MAVTARIVALVAGYCVYAFTGWAGGWVHLAACYARGPCPGRVDLAFRVGLFAVSLWLGIRTYRRIVREHAPAPLPPGTQALVLFGLAALLVVGAGIAGVTCAGCGTGEGYVLTLLPILVAIALVVAGFVVLSISMLRHPAPRPQSRNEGPSPLENFMALDGRPAANVRRQRDE